MNDNIKRPCRRTIGPGWSDDPAERDEQIDGQEKQIGDMADLLEVFDDYQLGDL